MEDDLNLDPAALETFAAYLDANEEAAAASRATFMVHNSNNDNVQ
jgi:hypothetical protein